MKTSRTSFFMISAIFLTACGTTGQGAPQFRKISIDEASSFERSLTSRTVSIPQEPQHLYTQPVNKTQSCKLFTSKEQLNRNNFRAYWDGQCRNGFAYGLGRDIAISDTHHYEEITTYSENGKIVNSPTVTYDFVNNEVTYRFIGNKFPSHTSFNEKIENNPGNFNISYSAYKINEAGDNQAIYWSAFDHRRVLINTADNIVYKYSEDKFAQNTNSANPIFIAETLDRQSGKPGGFTIVRYGNNQTRHFKIGQPEPVELPKEYFAEVEKKYREISDTQAEISRNVELAKRMEREYLYLACNGKHNITGLENGISNKICAWRDQFQEPFKAAQKKYIDNLESIKNAARSQEDQRRTQEQLDYQRRLVQAAERQAGAAEGANFQQMLNSNRVKTCYTNFGITSCY